MTERPRVEYRLPGITVREFRVRVPVDWNAYDAHGGAAFDLLVRELVDPGRAQEDLPLLLYLEGGPGGAAPRPTSRSGWIDEALSHYRVVLIDQRGTGASFPIEAAMLEHMSGAEGAAFLANFRADAIIRDLEYVRHAVYAGRTWSLLGQSYGGFLSLTYLSTAPEAITAGFICGGVPGTPPSAAEVYARTFARARARSVELFRRFPGDEHLVAQIADRLAAGEVVLPDGDRLTVRRFQALGMMLGMSAGYERLHWLLECAISPDGRFSGHFLERVMTLTSSAADPLFWTMQENIYADRGSGPTAWAAQRELANHPDFAEDQRPLRFTTEMAFPWMFEEIRLLRGFGPAVHALAERDDWPVLYDLDRLASNEVPLAAAVYFDDVYVDSGLQLDTLSRIGCARAWVTNEFEHDGISTGRVLTRLRELIGERTGGRA